MKPSIYAVGSEYPARLFIMPKPSGEWLDDDMAHYQSLGVGAIVSLLERDEVVALSLEEEPRVCAERGIEFLSLPIPDRGLPEAAEFDALIRAVVERVRGGRSVAVHCRAGIGRSGMVVCCALACLEGSGIRAIEEVSRARGVAVPDTNEQRAFIEARLGQ